MESWELSVNIREIVQKKYHSRKVSLKNIKVQQRNTVVD